MRTGHAAGAVILTLLAATPVGSPVADSPVADALPLVLPVTAADIDANLKLNADAGAGRDESDAASTGPDRSDAASAVREESEAAEPARVLSSRHYERDLKAMQNYRPGYEFWRHVFTIPNGRIAFGSAADGELLATFPLRGDWAGQARWEQAALADLFAGQTITGAFSVRRDSTAQLLEQNAGPIVYNETRGSFIAEGVELYGSFLTEWGQIFERFGVPAHIGLAQGLAESGLRGRVRSEAGAIGFCQWLPGNWERLQALSPHTIEVYNQTTQVPYCAAHLAVLAAKYGSLIPALSEHHAGSVNVGRAMINGDFAGGDDVHGRYFLGAELTLLVRQARPPGYRDVVGGYGPRSFRYAEMVFGNTGTIAEFESAIEQQAVFAMRPSRAVSFDEVARRTGLSIDEIRRFNPALINRVPASANLYLPYYIEEFGADSAFWRRDPTAAYRSALGEFLRLDERFTVDHWYDGTAFETLQTFADRFLATGTEEGTVMATVIAYVMKELSDGRQLEILSETRGSERARQLREQGVRQREALFELVDGETAVDGQSSGWARRSALLTTAGLRLP